MSKVAAMCRSPTAAGGVGNVRLELAQQVEELLLLFLTQDAEEIDDPLLVLGSHALELTLTFRREIDSKNTAIGRVDFAYDKAFFLEAVRDAGDITPCHHHPLRQLAHFQALGRALELRHEVEARQGRIEARLQVLPNTVLVLVRSGQNAQPQSQRYVVIVVNACFGIHLWSHDDLECSSFLGRVLRHYVTSPPATTMLWPVILSAPGPQTHKTVCATSSGVIRRRCGFVATRDSNASASVRPVLRTMLAIASRTMSVSVYPGHTALTVMFLVASSSASERVRPMTACFDATYVDLYAPPRSPAMLATLTMRPYPTWSMSPTACRVHR